MRIRPHLTGDKVVVVAEVGNNHEGDPERALRMVEAAASTGAGTVITEADIVRERPMTGFAVGGEAALLGRKLTVGQKMGELSATTNVTGRPRPCNPDQGRNPSR